MKKRFFLALAAASAVLAGSCQKQDAPSAHSEAEEGTLTVRVAPRAGMSTRAVSAYDAAQPYETAVNNVQLFVFDGTGRLNAYRDLGKDLTGNISVISGHKTVYALINAPAVTGVTTLSELESRAVSLTDNSTDPSRGFVMAGKAECDVQAGSATCSVSASRLAARVVLKSVTNSLPASYGAIRIERAFLSNVVANQNAAGTAEPSLWYNREGRMDEDPLVEGHVIDGETYTASAPELTYSAIGAEVAQGQSHEPSSPHLFYTFANASTAMPSGFSAQFAPQRTVLNVVATVGGETYHYPVVLKNGTVDRNTTYTVALTVTGLGSKDPNAPVSKGGLDATVTVEGWSAGPVYDETI